MSASLRGGLRKGLSALLGGGRIGSLLRMTYRGVLPLESLSRRECLVLLGSTPVGRIGVNILALPVILPVNFALFDDAILVRTVPGTKLDAATHDAVVAFQADSYEPDGSTGWSVLVVGTASEITDPVETERAAAVPIAAWAVDDRADHFIRIAVTTITGRRYFRLDGAASSGPSSAEA